MPLQTHLWNRIVPAGVLLFLVAPALIADVSTVREAVLGIDHVETVSTWISERSFRSSSSASALDVLFDRATGKTFLIVKSQKRFIELPFDALTAAMPVYKDFLSHAWGVVAVKREGAGSSNRISGVDCSDQKLQFVIRADIPGLPNPGMLVDLTACVAAPGAFDKDPFRDAMKYLFLSKLLLQSSPSESFKGADYWTESYRREVFLQSFDSSLADGFIVKADGNGSQAVRDRDLRHPRVYFEYKEISTKAIPPEVFSVPSGYQRMPKEEAIKYLKTLGLKKVKLDSITSD
jgi:hypothetical protein